MPKVSVIMPVYNTAPFVGEAIRSILSQTHGDFEFIVIDNASEDGSGEIIRGFDDRRIRAVRNEKNRELADVLNQGFGLAQGEYIARMDSDDVSLPRRLEKQVALLDADPDTRLCGTWSRTFGAGHHITMKYPVEWPAIQAYCLFASPFCHPSVMIRRTAIAEHGLEYDASYNPAEDFELWTRVAQTVPCRNIPEVLLHYRVRQSSMSRTDSGPMGEKVRRLAREHLARIDIVPTEEEEVLHQRVAYGTGLDSFEEVERAEQWLDRIRDQNQQTSAFPEPGMQQAIGLVWFRTILNTLTVDRRVYGKYRASRFRSGYRPSAFERLLMIYYMTRRVLRI